MKSNALVRGPLGKWLPSWIFDLIIIIILFIERHVQQAVRDAVQHSKAALSVIINLQVNYFKI